MTRPSRKPTIGRRLITSLDRIGFAGQGLSGQSELFNRAPSPMLAERGVRAAVIYDGGFAEQGENGRRLQAQNRRDLSSSQDRAVRPQLHGRPQPGLFQYDLSARIFATRRASPAMSASSHRAAPFA
jgi:hypothetical protein